MNPDDIFAESLGRSYVEPSAEIRVACAQIRQLYLGLVEQGFEDRQALVIVGQVIAAGSSGSGTS